MALVFALASGFLFVRPFAIRPKLNSEGHMLFKDGTPFMGGSVGVTDLQMEKDYLGELKTEWPGYLCLLVGACFVGRAIFVLCRPSPKTNSEQ
jgi:hypothetical protein